MWKKILLLFGSLVFVVAPPPNIVVSDLTQSLRSVNLESVSYAIHKAAPALESGSESLNQLASLKLKHPSGSITKPIYEPPVYQYASEFPDAPHFPPGTGLGRSFSVKLGDIVRVEKEAFTIVKSLGSGEAGYAYVAKQSASGEEVVLKTFKKWYPYVIDTFKSEVTVLKRLGNLISYDPDRMLVVQKKIEGESLQKVIQRTRDPIQLEALKTRYIQAIRDFEASTGLIHGGKCCSRVTIKMHIQGMS